MHPFKQLCPSMEISITAIAQGIETLGNICEDKVLGLRIKDFVEYVVLTVRPEERRRAIQCCEEGKYSRITVHTCPSLPYGTWFMSYGDAMVLSVGV